MGFPLFRFTLDNAIEGSLAIDEPDGWDDAVLLLERDKEYHSLVEFYQQALTFYGDNASHDAGIAYIRNIEQTQGVEAIITITIETSYDDGDTWEDMFIGTIDLSTVIETDFYKISAGVLRDDFWAKFFNRKNIPVDLSSTTDLDGGIRAAVSSIVLPLPSQKVRSNRISYSQQFGADSTGTHNNRYYQIGFDLDELAEIEDWFSIPTDINSNLPVNILSAKYAGSYTFNDIRINAFTADTLDPDLWDLSTTGIFSYPIGDDISDYVEFYLRHNDTDYPLALTILTPNAEGQFRLSSPLTLDLEVGDEITIYGIGTANMGLPASDYFIWGGYKIIGSAQSLVDITSDTVYTDTETDAFLLKDAGESLLSKLVGADNVLESDYLEESSPIGCGAQFALMKGLHVRGYSFADKPMFMTFDDWWNGANPIFNLGLGYETGNRIRIEQKSYFYNHTTVLNLDFVNEIERSYDLSKIFKSIETGYSKSLSESASGIDDPQTKRNYRTKFAAIGKDEKILSKFLAAGLAIERSRRNRVEEGKDDRNDEEIAIIALQPGSPEWVPEFDENFVSVTNLLNSDARYNIRLSCARNFIRWRPFFNGCMQWQNGSFMFASGEGNYDMISELDSSDCDYVDDSPAALSESQDIQSTNEFLFIPVVYKFDYPITWEQYKTIRDNRNNAIGVSRTDSGHIACHILSLEWQPTRSLGKFTVILAENEYL